MLTGKVALVDVGARPVPPVRWIRSSISALATTPVSPRVSRRGSDWWAPKIVQQDSSPRMRTQVPREAPVGLAVR
jgi:hypothetical protein